jgi:tRNA synthetases class I (W and Y)
VAVDTLATRISTSSARQQSDMLAPSSRRLPALRWLSKQPFIPHNSHARLDRFQSSGRWYTSNVEPRQVIFSGIQPTGVPHLGNYLGALRRWRELQDSASPSTQLIYSIVDLHAITVRQNPDELRNWKRESLAALLAVGLDPERSTIFYQSDVSGNSNLTLHSALISSNMEAGAGACRIDVDPKLYRFCGVSHENDTVEGEQNS